MSLSFVSSAVQTGTADGGFEETPIESKEVAQVNKQNSHKPLFEQLRANQEEEDAKREEQQRELMRGTMALDEDDVAHLDAIHKQKMERERLVQQQTQDELAAFRAARMERTQALSASGENEGDQDAIEEDLKDRPVEVANKTATSKAKTAPLKPKIIVKKRRKRTEAPASETGDSSKKQKAEEDDKAKSSEENADEKSQSKSPSESAPAGGLGGLLGGYGSDSDSDWA